MSHLEFLNLTCRLDEGNFPWERERTIHWNISLHLLRTRVIVQVFLLIRTSLDCLQNYNWERELLDYTSSRLLWSSNYSILCKILFFQTVLSKQMQFFKNFQLSFKVGELLCLYFGGHVNGSICPKLPMSTDRWKFFPHYEFIKAS